MTSYPVIVYEADDFNGRSAKFAYGQYPDMSLTGVGNDVVSSMRVAAFTLLELYEHSYYKGRKVTIKGPMDVSSLRFYQGEFNDYTSSIKVIRLEPSYATKLACCAGNGGLCAEFAPGSARCEATMLDYCTVAGGMGTPQCQSWCRANPAKCDNAVIKYCASNPTDPFCTCILSPAQTKGLVNPKCIDRKCLDTGYVTSNMLSTNCPSMVTCSITAALANSGLILSNTIPIQQNCGNTTVVAPPPVKPGVPVVIPPPVVAPPVMLVPPNNGSINVTDGVTTVTPPVIYPTPAPPASSSISPILILLFVLCLALAILGGVVIWRRRKRAQANMAVPTPVAV